MFTVNYIVTFRFSFDGPKDIIDKWKRELSLRLKKCGIKLVTCRENKTPRRTILSLEIDGVSLEDKRLATIIDLCIENKNHFQSMRIGAFSDKVNKEFYPAL